jgi:chromosome segregation and condensation protein ScpB
MYYPATEDMTDEELIQFAHGRGIDTTDLREAVDNEQDSSAERAALIKALDEDRDSAE